MSANSENDAMGSFIKGQKNKGEEQPTYNKKMDDLSAFDTFVPPDTLQIQNLGEEIHEGTIEQQAPQPQFRESPNQQYNGFQEPQRPNMPLDHEDEILFSGGPAKSELESWKKQFESQGLEIWIVDDLPTGQIFIYRDINRYEYKAIMATPNTDALMREELICEQCVLFPWEYSYAEMANGKAGIVSVVSQHILGTSGFVKASMPRRL